MISKLVKKLFDLEYRNAFVAAQINIGIPFQIRSLMKARGWTQEKLAERSGMLQPRISSILKPGKARLNLDTLLRLASAFDVALAVRFVPFSELVDWSERFNPDSFHVSSFENDLAFDETQRDTSISDRAMARRRRGHKNKLKLVSPKKKGAAANTVLKKPPSRIPSSGGEIKGAENSRFGGLGSGYRYAM